MRYEMPGKKEYMSETVVMEPNIVEMLTTAALLQDIPDFPLLLAATRR